MHVLPARAANTAITVEPVASVVQKSQDRKVFIASQRKSVVLHQFMLGNAKH